MKTINRTTAPVQALVGELLNINLLFKTDQVRVINSLIFFLSAPLFHFVRILTAAGVSFRRTSSFPDQQASVDKRTDPVRELCDIQVKTTDLGNACRVVSGNILFSLLSMTTAGGNDNDNNNESCSIIPSS